MYLNSEDKVKELKQQMKISPEKVSIYLENFIRNYTNKLERSGTILGLSGGIDSAVVASLCKRAVGPENTLALIMPEKDSEKEHIRDAVNFARELNIEFELIDISKYIKSFGAYKLFTLNKLPLSKKLKRIFVRKAYDFYEKKTGKPPFLSSISGFEGKEFASYLKKTNAYYRIKHRIRMLLLYMYAELENKLVVGAANKSEYKIGFFVKYGCDDNADIMPLLNLYKTQVRELAVYLNIPFRIIKKPPSPDIIPGITDEIATGVPYEKLDLVLLALEKGWRNSRIAEVLELEEKKIIYVKNLIEKSEHMRKVYVPEIFI